MGQCCEKVQADGKQLTEDRTESILLISLDGLGGAAAGLDAVVGVTPFEGASSAKNVFTFFRSGSAVGGIPISTRASRLDS